MKYLKLLICLLVVSGCSDNPEVVELPSDKDSLGFTSVVQNKNYVYGVFGKNKAAVKCVEMDNISFVYISVAGTKRKMVELLRNEISKTF